MNAVAKVDPTLPGMPEPAEPSMFELIMRAVKDPACDPVKMAQLLELSREIRKDNAKAAYTTSLVKMKPVLPVIDRRGRIQIHEKGKEKIDQYLIQSTAFALWEDIDAAITPILAEHGFALTFRCGTTGAPEHRVTVTGVLSHEQGHSEETTMTLPLDTSGSKNNVQAVGSSTSYGKRYTASLLLNLRTKGEDDDGDAGGFMPHNAQHSAIHNSPTMQPDDGDPDGQAAAWGEQQKTFLNNCTTVADVQNWEELRADSLGRMKRKNVKIWSDVIRHKEARIGNINLAPKA